MSLHGIASITSLLLCLAGLVPVNSLVAAPNLARATATVSARILEPVSLGVSYTAATRQTRLRVSRPDNRVFQLHINKARHHSYYHQSHSEQSYPLPPAPKKLKLAQNSPSQTYVTLYFN